MKIVEWVFTGLDIALKAGKTVDDLCLFLKTADGLRQIMGITEFKQTNAGRIRSMSDEELAEFCGRNAGCAECVAKVGDDCEECREVWLDWLKQEVTE